MQPSTSQDSSTSTTQNSTDLKNDKPFLSQAVLLRLLTELAKSYAAVARLIVDFTCNSSELPSKKINVSL